MIFPSQDSLSDFINHINNHYDEPFLSLDKNGNLTLRRGNYKNKRQYDSICNYINSLFDRYSRLLVIRLDLKYTKEFAPYCTYEQASEDMDHLLLNRRFNKLFQHMVGYLWKLEQGTQRDGLHFHTLLFFDNQYVQNASYYAYSIGEYWASTITKGRGSYFYHSPSEYLAFKYPALGVVHRSDETKRLGLYQIAAYFADPDQTVLNLPPNARVIGYGQIRK